MKKIRHGSIMSLIYAVLIAIPMVSIVSRFIYVQSNKNAKDSYGGFNENQVEYVEPSQVELYEQYNFINNTYTISQFGYIDINLLSINSFSGDLTNRNLIEQTNRVYISDSSNRYIFYDNSNYLTEINTQNTTLDLTIVITATNFTNMNELKPLLLEMQINGNETLDNAFDYSLSQYVTDNSFGNLNLFEWWSNLFLDLSQSKNALYIHFINWYMNYVLFVSSSYILFMVLMWFINYSRKLMERGLNYDW